MTNQIFPRWPPSDPFAAAGRDTLQDGTPDFPSGAGPRELGKFRQSATPKLDTIAVVNDDGTQIGWALIPSVDETNYLLRAVVMGLSLLTEVDLLEEVDDTQAS